MGKKKICVISIKEDKKAFLTTMENESGRPEAETRPKQVYLGCHEEKRGAYTCLYKRQVM